MLEKIEYIKIYISKVWILKTVLKNWTRALSGPFYLQRWRFKNWKESQSFFCFLHQFIFLLLPSSLCGIASVGVLQDSLALALRRSEINEGLTLRNATFRISLRWPIHIINPVDRTKLIVKSLGHLTEIGYETNRVGARQRSQSN